MGDKTAIEWADATFNPWWGCTKVSVGDKGACEYCYAETLGHRFGVEWGPHAERRLAGPKHWELPAKLNRQAQRDQTRPFVFCASMADIFDNQVPTEWRARAFDAMRRADRCVWLLLTKRPSMIEKLSAEAGGLPPNAAIGCSSVTNKEAARDISHLLAAKATLRPLFAFCSMEPLMEAVALNHLDCDGGGGEAEGFYQINALTGRNTDMTRPCRDVPTLDWVIAGGESGQHARPSHPDWFRSLRDQCAAAGVPFLFKQWGEWAPPRPAEPYSTAEGRAQKTPTFIVADDGTSHCFWNGHARDHNGVAMRRLGKAKAGRLIDGREHNGFPAGFGKGERAAA